MAEDIEVVLKPRKKHDFAPNSRLFYDVAVVGGGVGGLAAAMYSARMGLKVLLLSEYLGGTISLTHSVENYPGFVSISGSDLAKAIENHAKDYAIDIQKEKVEKVVSRKKDEKTNFKIHTKNHTFTSKTVVFATGSKWRKLGVPGEQNFENRGVSYCALCDGAFFKGKTVGVVGGADSAIKEGILLANYAKKVYIIYRGEKVHPEPITMKNADRLIKQDRMEIINNTNITEIKGDQTVTHVIFDRPFKGKKEFELDGVFVYIGHIPRSELAKEMGVKVNGRGEIVVDKDASTSVPGVYAAGDVTDIKFKQAITGVAQGVTAAYNAYEYINKGEFVLPCDECKDKNETSVDLEPLVKEAKEKK